MEEALQNIAAVFAMMLEATAVIFIMIGAIEAVCRCLFPFILKKATQGMRRDAWLSFARWLLLGLEFTLGADIIRSAISPTWDDIGMLAAVAVIRTFLNYFLERDLQQASNERTIR